MLADGQPSLLTGYVRGRSLIPKPREESAVVNQLLDPFRQFAPGIDRRDALRLIIDRQPLPYYRRAAGFPRPHAALGLDE